MNIDEIPILKSLMEYRDEEVISFHMPGHKKGRAQKKAGLDLWAGDLLSMDTTEVPGIDNLHSPEAAILSAQRLAAAAFGADESFLLVNGTTCGIYTMIMAATEPGDKIIIPRNCHRSVYGAVILGRLTPVYIEPEMDGELGIALGIKPETVEYTLEKHGDAKAVVITNPTYYGTCSDLKKIAEIVHERNALLLVDEAHGSHFSFSERLPMSALQAGADMTAQSIHKTMPAMTQGSMLHVRYGRVNIERVRLFLQLTQTTSPSHILLASLDTARYIMQVKGRELLSEIIDWSNWARKEINSIPGLYCLNTDRIGRYGVADIDPTRITVNFGRLGMDGKKAEAILRKSFKLQVEMSDLYNIVAISTVGNTHADYEQLVKALGKLALSGERGEAAGTAAAFQKTSELCIMPWEAVYCEKEQVAFGDSIDRVCGEMIIPYPPGIPVLMPGERINAEAYGYLQACVEKGIKINGALDTKLESICVIKDGQGAIRDGQSRSHGI